MQKYKNLSLSDHLCVLFKKIYVKTRVKTHYFMIFFVIITLYPVLNTLAVSLNDGTDALRGGIYLWPRVFTWKNYETEPQKLELPHAPKPFLRYMEDPFRPQTRLDRDYEGGMGVFVL